MASTDTLSVTLSRRGLAAIAGRDANRVVVVLRGDHDVSTVAALRETLAQAIILDYVDLVVDLSGVPFMDASTLSAIVRAREYLQRRSLSLTLRSPSRSATRVLELCDLAELVDPGPVVATRMKPRMTSRLHLKPKRSPHALTSTSRPGTPAAVSARVGWWAPRCVTSGHRKRVSRVMGNV
jgi:anti-anti-sigma factor